MEIFDSIIKPSSVAPWFTMFESFFIRRMKQRIDDCFSRPTTGVPGRFIRCIERVSYNMNEYFTYPGAEKLCLNLSSYNYLGFAQSEGTCTDFVINNIDKWGVSSNGPRNLLGTTQLHLDTEALVARFVGKDDCIITSMGYSTNANFFNSFLNKNCLVISDELNHASIRTGVRLSGASVKPYKHNDMKVLEQLLREQISEGQPKTHKPWDKILICVEGLFSMEGTMCNLPELVKLKKKYKCYLFVDEAHSIGAMGPNGRGVCEYFGIDPNDVDVLMGTFTKSFGAAGGYIAADQKFINRLRLDLTTQNYAEPSPTPVLSQVYSSMKIIMGEMNPGEGLERLSRITFNSRYLRLGLQRLGFIVYGIADSPVVPLLLYAPSKMPAFSRLMLERNIAVVIVAYPATPLTESRVRFCISASLTKEDIDYVLRHVDEVGDMLFLKTSSGIGGGSLDGKPPRWNIEDVIAKTPEDCKDDRFFTI
ncbi:PLP-dependent transferase [Hanseniaspora valbyensis NRRL Y-1626]|uniref:serine C-palmitoyltransferase n=1 Tax=Hanseniaspora valbyensis NRRL Y-1626 TaxID=766949 RepID=A0A1B7TIK9_9ASCO|nr:PLP-dependent transferase [Hanseniaspora valbyensis NRRL Y-1626]